MKLKSTIEQRPIHRHRRAMNRIQPYRTVRAVWIANCSALILTAVVTISAVDPDTHKLYPEFHILFSLGINMVLFNMLYLFNFRLLRSNLKGVQIVSIGLVGSIVIALIAAFVFFTLEHLVYGDTFGQLGVSLIINTSMALIAYLVSMLLYNANEYQRALTENEHLQAENLRIHHEALEKQLSPHYLFNTLNTLDGLIGMDDDRAHTYLGRLAATLRYTLQQQRDVSLAEELQFTRSYIYLMQTRYGDALSITIDIPDDLLGRRVPAISLQLLIENAIKHNVITQRHPLEIKVKGYGLEVADGNSTPISHTTSPKAFIEVCNPLQPKADSETSTGIGLDNLAMRYQLIFNREISITHTDQTFTVKIPLV